MIYWPSSRHKFYNFSHVFINLSTYIFKFRFMLVIHYWLLMTWQVGHIPLMYNILGHYSDVIMSVMASQITSVSIFAQPFVQAHMKENIKAPRHWSLWGEATGAPVDSPHKRASNAENVSVWWRFHGLFGCDYLCMSKMLWRFSIAFSTHLHKYM